MKIILMVNFKKYRNETVSWMMGHLLHREDGPSFIMKYENAKCVVLRHLHGNEVK